MGIFTVFFLFLKVELFWLYTHNLVRNVLRIDIYSSYYTYIIHICCIIKKLFKKYLKRYWLFYFISSCFLITCSTKNTLASTHSIITTQKIHATFVKDSAETFNGLWATASCHDLLTYTAWCIIFIVPIRWSNDRPCTWRCRRSIWMPCIHGLTGAVPTRIFLYIPTALVILVWHIRLLLWCGVRVMRWAALLRWHGALLTMDRGFRFSLLAG
jgi:hypothetical protein